MYHLKVNKRPEWYSVCIRSETKENEKSAFCWTFGYLRVNFTICIWKTSLLFLLYSYGSQELNYIVKNWVESGQVINHFYYQTLSIENGITLRLVTFGILRKIKRTGVRQTRLWFLIRGFWHGIFDTGFERNKYYFFQCPSCWFF